MSVVYFSLLVGVLVLTHELGHFVAAKLLDVKVQRLSIGWGRPLVRATLGETEYQIAAFPIGGYVSILGTEPTPEAARGHARDDVGRSIESRPLWQKLVIAFSGPAANLLLPVVIYFVFFAGHTTLQAAQIGDVLDGGSAARAGLEPGDRVLEIDGRAIRYWEEIDEAVRTSPGKELHLRIQRHGKVFERYVTPLEETVRHRDGRVQVEGRVGITHAPFIPIVGVIDGKSPAARSGLRTGDLLISVDGQAVRNWRDVQQRLGRFARRASIVYFRGTELPGVPQIRLLSAGFADLVPQTQVSPTLERQTYTGLEHAEMFVAHVEQGPAHDAGLRVGDLIVALDDKPVEHWMDLDQRLQAEPDKTFKLTWKRAVDGTTEVRQGELKQEIRAGLDEYGHTVKRLVFGASNDVDRGTGAMVPIEGRFGYALAGAFDRTGDTISTATTGFVRILRGDAPSEALGGPLTIYRVVSGSQGWDRFLLLLALVSVNLGLLNLLPIPRLDGGHLLVFAIEGARRRKLSPTALQRIERVGLVVVGVIVILALVNDLTR